MLTTGKPALRVLTPLLVVGLLSASATGCALLEGPTPDTPKREAPAEPKTAPEFFPEGSAADNLPYFTETMRTYAAGEGPVLGAPLVDSLVAAGFNRDTMQVSFDESKTGLAADNIFVSARFGADCLIGQLVAADRSFVASVQPAVGPNQDICLIGNTRPLDW